MWELRKFLSALLCLSVVSGCVPYWQGKEMRSDMLALQGQMEILVDDHRKQKQDLAKELRVLQKRLEVLDGELAASIGRLRVTDANSGSSLDNVRQSMLDLKGQLAEIKFKLEQREREINETKPPTMEPLPKSRKALFNYGTKKFEADDCVNSIRAFDAFSKRFPKDSYTDNALSYIGECQNQQGEYRAALRTLRRIHDEFPKGEKVDDAIFLMHESFLGLGKCRKAKIFLENMLENHPKSNRFRAAEKALKSLEKRCP